MSFERLPPKRVAASLHHSCMQQAACFPQVPAAPADSADISSKAALSSVQVLAPGSKAINVNDRIMDLYLQRLLPGITEPGDDNNYGSSAMGDVLCLQALSKRIHYGKFVAEAKFRCVGADLSGRVSVSTAPCTVAAPSCCNMMFARRGCIWRCTWWLGTDRLLWDSLVHGPAPENVSPGAWSAASVQRSLG